MKQNVLIIGTVFPEPGSSAAGSRMMQLIELFLSQGWKITFASAAADSKFMVDLQQSGIDKATIGLNSSSFDTFIQNLNPTIVMFDRFMTEEQFGWRVAENCPAALRIIDTEDLHSLRAARQKALKENVPFDPRNMVTEDVAKREAASILRCDLSLIISTVEMELLRAYFKIDDSLLQYIPFLLDELDENAKKAWKPFEARDHFISIGNFLHAPNRDAVQYLKETVWPLIRKQLPEAQLHIYGAYAPQQVNEWHKAADGFFVLGRAPDAKEVIGDAKILLAPLRFGAGIKGKLAEAMQCGTPSVTTSVGAEAMHDGLEWNGMIEDDAEQFAAAAVKLYNDKAAWERAQLNGVEIINSCYSKEIFGKQLLERMVAIQENIEEHRKQNFIGGMLMHHTISGTKYMSKWIEEKNKMC